MRRPSTLLLSLCGFVSVCFGAPFSQSDADDGLSTSDTASASSCLPNTRPGLYANLASGCRAYYRCDSNGLRTNFQCPTTTLFNQLTLKCDSASMALCGWSAQLANIANTPFAELRPISTDDTELSISSVDNTNTANNDEKDDSERQKRGIFDDDTEVTTQRSRRTTSSRSNSNSRDSSSNNNQWDNSNSGSAAPSSRSGWSSSGRDDSQSTSDQQQRPSGIRATGSASRGSSHRVSEHREVNGVGKPPAFTMPSDIEAGLNMNFDDWK